MVENIAEINVTANVEVWQVVRIASVVQVQTHTLASYFILIVMSFVERCLAGE